MSWKKANLFENLGKQVFVNEYGFCTFSVRAITINDKSIDQIFIKYSKEDTAYERFTITSYSNLLVHIQAVFNSDLATRKPSKNYYGYNNYYSSLPSAEANKLKVESLKIDLQVLRYAQAQSEYKEVVLEKESDASKYFCWITDKSFSESFKVANISKVKEGDKLFLVGVGDVLVKKVHPFPNIKNILFTVVDNEEITHDVTFGSDNIYYLPYEHEKDLIDEIDDASNEQLLLPYVSKSKEIPGVYNVYWEPVEEASRYIVSVYKIINAEKGVYYHLADYDIDRNTHYFAIDKLVGGDFVFKVTAEDRSGNVIAKSRGSVDKYPKTFRK